MGSDDTGRIREIMHDEHSGMLRELEVLIKKTKFLVGIGVALIMFGFGSAIVISKYETKERVETLAISLTARIDSNRDLLHQHENKISVTNILLNRLDEDNRWIRSTLYDLARRQGSRPIPPPSHSPDHLQGE